MKRSHYDDLIHIANEAIDNIFVEKSNLTQQFQQECPHKTKHIVFARLRVEGEPQYVVECTRCNLNEVVHGCPENVDVAREVLIEKSERICRND